MVFGCALVHHKINAIIHSTIIKIGSSATENGQASRKESFDLSHAVFRVNLK